MPIDPSAITRASKKERTRERILANAIALFREQGIRRTRLSEVAAASEISPATLFNYFPTKGRLAEAWVRGEVEAILAELITDALDRDRSLRSAIRAGCRKVAGASASEPALRLEAWHEAGRAAAPMPASPTISPPIAALVAGMREEQQRERVRADVPAPDLAEMLMDSIEGGLIAGLRSSIHTGESTQSTKQPATGASIEADLFLAIRSRVDLVLDGFRKRNERVAAPRGRPPPTPQTTRPVQSR